jgi:hypothetical protein
MPGLRSIPRLMRGVLAPNPSLNADVPYAGAARQAPGRRLASIR